MVVLPAPFGPRNPSTRPGVALKLSPSTATLAPKRFVRSRTSSTGGTLAAQPARAGPHGGKFARREAPLGIACAARSRARGCSGRACRAAPAAQAAPASRAASARPTSRRARATTWAAGPARTGWRRGSTPASGPARSCSSAATARSRSWPLDLFMVPGGLVKHVGDALAARGFSESNLLVSASHTHSGPGGYANFKTFNTAAPGLATVTDPLSFYRLLDAPPADPAALLVPGEAGRPRRSGGRTTTARRRRPAGAGPRSTGSRRTAASRRTSPTTGSSASAGRARRPRTPRACDHTIDPAGERPAGGQARAAVRQRPDRRLVDLRRPRHGHEVELPVLQRRTTTPRRSRYSSAACAGRAGCRAGRPC